MGGRCNATLAVVAMEACGSAHYWGREVMTLGHEVRLIPPIHVKPFVKTHKNDGVDAEAISEAAQRPIMRFVAVRTEAQQAQGMLFRTRDLLVRQRTQTISVQSMRFGDAFVAKRPAFPGNRTTALSRNGSGDSVAGGWANE